MLIIYIKNKEKLEY